MKKSSGRRDLHLGGIKKSFPEDDSAPFRVRQQSKGESELLSCKNKIQA